MANAFGADADTTGVTLRGHVGGDNTNQGPSWRMSSNSYAWAYIVGGLLLLWLLGGSFKSVLS